jgi:anti-sigma regulatory factor (Ser/Thr protein kinase)
MQAHTGSAAIHLTLPCGPTAPGLARAALRDALARRQIRDDATLVASELVTNAVTHSGCGQEHTITLDARISDGCLRIAVHDPGRTGVVPRVRDGGAGEAGGLGLRLVERLARRWGAERPDGCLVWAELALVDPPVSSFEPSSAL